MARKRKSEEDFFSCVGLPVTDTSLRTIIGRLRNDSKINNSRMRSERVRFQQLMDNIVSEVVTTEDGEVTLYATSIQKYIDYLQEKQPDYVQFLKKHLAAEQENRPDGIGILYIDECVPGNILAPDNRRKSYCIYFCYKNMAKFRSVNVWWPVAVLRHSEADKLHGGVAEFFTRTLRMATPFLTGLVLDSQTLIVTKTLFLIADEAALKACSGSKGASGLRPCIHCDAFSSARDDMAKFMGKASIACSDFSAFTAVDDNDILDILTHLQVIRDNQSRAKLEEAQKLLGWTVNDAVCFLDPGIKPYLQPSRFHYDAMHCYWSNGQVNCEVGLFFTEATRLAGITRNQLELFFSSCWDRTNASGIDTSGNLKDLVSAKLLKEGQDYKGSASQCLDVLPLLGFFAIEMLDNCEEMRPHVRSLIALWRVTSHILNAKNCIDTIHGLQKLQQAHLELFITCYTADKVRPKHHFASHIEQQALDAGILLDCFPGERKNNTFKHVLCPRISRLEGFEKAILLRWQEHDAEKLNSFTRDEIILRAQLDSSSTENVRVARHVFCCWGDIKAGNVMMMDEHSAIQVLGCVQEKVQTGSGVEDRISVAGVKLRFVAGGPKSSMLWSRWAKTKDDLIVPLQALQTALRTTFCSKDANEIIILR